MLKLTEIQKTDLITQNKVLIIYNSNVYKITDINEEDVGDWWEECLFLKEQKNDICIVITRIGFGFNSMHNLFRYVNKNHIEIII